MESMLWQSATSLQMLSAGSTWTLTFMTAVGWALAAWSSRCFFTGWLAAGGAGGQGACSGAATGACREAAEPPPRGTPLTFTCSRTLFPYELQAKVSTVIA